MFSQVSVCPQEGECMANGGHARQGGRQGEGCVLGGRGACVAGEMAISADGMHPTGMHSC